MSKQASNKGIEEAQRLIEKAAAEGSKRLWLSELGLTDADLAVLAAEIGELANLTELSLYGNQLASIPAEIGKLANLTGLYLDNNQLASIPAEIGKLANLTTLYLHNNQLASIPTEIGNLANLTTLSLSDNQLASIPAEIGNLANLTTLFLFNNQLASIPAEIGNLTNLTTLSLFNNPLPAELIELALKDARAAVEYAAELAGEGRAVREAKLVLIGEGKVGKTCLLRAFMGKPFRKLKSTAGVEVAIKGVPVKHQEVEYTLNAWDFAGQDIYRVTHQFFFTRRAVYLVLWNVRAGPTQGAVEFWLNTIKQRVGEQAKVFVVATHVRSEKSIEDIRKQDLMARYGDMIVGFAEVDSRTGFGVKELKARIAEVTAGLPEINDPVPARYLAGRRKLEELPKAKKWMKFRAFAEAAGMKEDVGAARRLAFLLSTWGRIVYFGDDGRGAADEGPTEGTLANYVVVRPEWLTKAIALILEDQNTKDGNGILQHARLPAIWETHGVPGRPKYARENHPFLLALMEKFSISYRLGSPENSKRSLVPQLIRTDRKEKGAGMSWVPGDTSDGRAEAALSVVMRENPPPGIVPLMIARTHHLSCDDRHWETGTFLRHERFGEAHMYLLDRELRFVARGDYPPYLLGQLSETAERLLSEWKGVKWDLAVPCPSCAEKLGGSGERGNFSHKAIVGFRQKNPGRTDMYCQVCQENVPVERLLSGWSGGIDPLSRMEAKFDRMSERVDEVRDGVRELLLREPLSTAEAMEQFARLYRFLNDQRRLAPSTYSVKCEEGARWFEKKTHGQFRVTLWCENPDGPHPVVPIGSGGSGEYVLPFAKEWLVRAAPWIKWGLLALRTAAPLAGQVLSAGLDEKLFKDIKQQLDMGIEAMKAMPSGELDAKGRPRLGEFAYHSLEGAALREFHGVMAEKFKDGRWGDLEYAELPDKSWRWMCAKCRARLSPGPQMSLGR
ncbi:MAG: COR domain-containing protein [Phycisphaerales bacterium]